MSAMLAWISGGSWGDHAVHRTQGLCDAKICIPKLCMDLGTFSAWLPVSHKWFCAQTLYSAPTMLSVHPSKAHVTFPESQPSSQKLPSKQGPLGDILSGNAAQGNLSPLQLLYPSHVLNLSHFSQLDLCHFPSQGDSPKASDPTTRFCKMQMLL